MSCPEIVILGASKPNLLNIKGLTPASRLFNPAISSSASNVVAPNIVSTMASPKERGVFPNFDDADVIIQSPNGKVWKLHSLILCNASSVLKDILEGFGAARLKRADVKEGRFIRWKLIMVGEPLAQNADSSGTLYRRFKAVDPNSSTIPAFMNFNGLGEGTGFNRIYDNFFRCLYNLEPNFESDAENHQNTYILDATNLLQAATFLNARASVRIVIEAHLLRLNQLLWYHIANKPEGWASLACRMQSPIILREAMIHIVGRFTLKEELGIRKQFLYKLEYGEAIYRLAFKKAAELKDKKLYIERRLCEFFPDKMVHKENPESLPGRAVYAGDIYLWQALTLVRQYFASAYQSNMHHRAPDGGLSFYRTVLNGDMYLRADTLERFHKSFDMSSKGRACLAAALEYVKEELKPIVRPLLKDLSQATRGPNQAPLNHLTCTVILDEELPWYETLDPGPVSVSGGGEGVLDEMDFEYAGEDPTGGPGRAPPA